MSQKYEIWSQRYEERSQRYKTFGAATDQEALGELEKFEKDPSNSWSRGSLYRIETRVEPVEHKVPVKLAKDWSD